MPVSDGIVGPIPEGRDPDTYDRLRRRVLWSMPTGLFVVGSRVGERRNLMTANWVMQVATTPKLVVASVERESVTAALIAEGGGFSVSLLSRTDRAVVRRFVKPVEDVVAGPVGRGPCHAGGAGARGGRRPALSGCGGRLAVPVGYGTPWTPVLWTVPHRASHVLFVGEVVDAGERAAEPTTDHPGLLRMEDTRMNYGG